MLDKRKKIAIYMEGHLFTENGKMGFGALRYLSNPIVAVIDSENGGKNISEITLISRDVPIVSNIDVAIENGAEVLLLGIANSGGQIPKSWFPIINLAVERGLSIINGLLVQVRECSGGAKGLHSSHLYTCLPARDSRNAGARW